MDYKLTLNLPTTAFPMKANLAQREPELLAHWLESDLYKKLRTLRAGRPHFILPDGPPYANGVIHIGHAVNKTLKDMVIKIKHFSGFDAPFVPGWDCHGLPIELNVEKKIGLPTDALSAEKFRQACRNYAKEQIELQKKGFQRLGVLGDWQNPYLTMDYTFEANVVRSLSILIERGHLHQGKKPVHWCLECGSALAEAEVEYADKVSSAIDVRFQLVDNAEFNKRFNLTIEGPIALPIWTTTPWTLPANQAVSVNPEANYVLVKHNNEYLILAQALLEACIDRFNITTPDILSTFTGSALAHLKLQHPFEERTVPVVLGSHVTLDTGTGAVHTAPAHGIDDFLVGQQNELSMDNPVQNNGCFAKQVPFVGGMHVRKVEATLIQVLTEKGALLHQEKIQHSYPHCWRHKTPLIFMSTPQWFVSMEQQHLREHTLKALPTIQWVPQWGENRMTGMINGRPDWCISRQRHWGTPLALIIHKQTRALHPNMTALMEIIAQKIELGGVDAWHSLSLDTLIPEDAHDYEKTTDILDVWFDSGVVHQAVLRQRPDLRFPADLYLEGSDQHRGWFQSSLLTSMGMNDTPPYKAVLTHGFAVDAKGHKMSKSIGNVVAPEKVIDTLGADVLRLWIASTDYTGDLTVSDEILKRTADAYRKLRNTMRFLLANLHDFTPEDCLPPEQLLALDAFMLARGEQLQKEVLAFYNDYQFHFATQALHQFCTNDLSSFYLDVIKDRQYTCKATSRARRSAQTTLFHLAHMLVRLYAPILSFTAEEVWRYLPGERSASVFLNEWYAFPTITTHPTISNETWEVIMRLRETINKQLESLRAEGKIGGNLDADIKLFCSQTLLTLLKPLEDELRFAFITSEATLHPLSEKSQAAIEVEKDNLFLEVTASPYVKCERCWHHRPDVGRHLTHPTLCIRCIDNIEGPGEDRQFI